jgi:hypothetical protein
MNRSTTILMFVAVAMLSALPLVAQQKRVSPHETIGAMVDGDRVTIVYGRPYTRSPKTGEMRKIWGGLVPYGKVWRMGADEATLLITQKPIVVGGTTVPAGACTLFMLPEENGAAKLIINKQIGQWGLQYDEKEDIARVDLQKAALEKPVDQFTMAIAEESSGGGTLKLIWENAEFSVPFTVAK